MRSRGALIELLLPERFPGAGRQARMQEIPPTMQTAPAPAPQVIANTQSELVPEPVAEPVILGHVAPPRPEYARVAPLAPQR